MDEETFFGFIKKSGFLRLAAVLCILALGFFLPRLFGSGSTPPTEQEQIAALERRVLDSLAKQYSAATNEGKPYQTMHVKYLNVPLYIGDLDSPGSFQLVNYLNEIVTMEGKDYVLLVPQMFNGWVDGEYFHFRMDYYLDNEHGFETRYTIPLDAMTDQVNHSYSWLSSVVDSPGYWDNSETVDDMLRFILGTAEDQNSQLQRETIRAIILNQPGSTWQEQLVNYTRTGITDKQWEILNDPDQGPRIWPGEYSNLFAEDYPGGVDSLQ